MHVFEFEWNVPEEVLFSYSLLCQKSDILCASWLLLLQDVSVEPQTGEAVKMLPETSAVWSNKRFYLCRLDREKKKKKRNNVTITVQVIHFGIGYGLEESLLWLCYLLLPLFFYCVDFVFLYKCNASVLYKPSLRIFLCIYERNLETCFETSKGSCFFP